MKTLMNSGKVSGFTIIEMLVACAVFTILMLLVDQLLVSAVNISSEQTIRMASQSQAQTIFSRMQVDFSNMIKRADCDNIFACNHGNDSCFFYSEAPSNYSTSSAAYQSTGNPVLKNSVSLIGYRVNANYQLERLGKSLNFNPTSSTGTTVPIFLSYLNSVNPTAPFTLLSASTISGNWSSTVGSSPSFTNGTDTDYTVLGDQVFRMEICFLKSDGTYFQPAAGASYPSVNLSPYSPTASSTATVTTTPTTVTAIVVTLAMLDDTTRSHIPTATLNQNFANVVSNVLVDPSQLAASPPILPAQVWYQGNQGNPCISNPVSVSSSTGMISSAVSKIQIYQQYFYLNMPL